MANQSLRNFFVNTFNVSVVRFSCSIGI